MPLLTFFGFLRLLHGFFLAVTDTLGHYFLLVTLLGRLMPIGFCFRVGRAFCRLDKPRSFLSVSPVFASNVERPNFLVDFPAALNEVLGTARRVVLLFEALRIALFGVGIYSS